MRNLLINIQQKLQINDGLKRRVATMSEKIDVSGLLNRSMSATPIWILAICGSFIAISLSIIAILQLGGFTTPLQRIMNAKATQLERTTESLTASAVALEDVTSRITTFDARLGAVEYRLGSVEQMLARADQERLNARSSNQ